MRTSEEIADRAYRRLEALIVLDFPQPQCVNKQKAWKAEISKIKKMVADRLGNNGININVQV